MDMRMRSRNRRATRSTNSDGRTLRRRQRFCRFERNATADRRRLLARQLRDDARRYCLHHATLMARESRSDGSSRPRARPRRGAAFAARRTILPSFVRQTPQLAKRVAVDGTGAPRITESASVETLLCAHIERDTVVLARGPSTRGRRMDFRDSLAMHPARLRSAYGTKLRAPDSHALTPALRSPEVVDIRDSLAMHPARFPLQNKRRPRAKAA